MTAETVSIPKAKHASKDPAFRVIERHWKTIEKLYDPTMGKSIWNDRCAERVTDATCMLFATRPTTRSGLLAFLSYLSERSVKGGIGLGEQGAAIATVLQSIEASCTAIAFKVPARAVPVLKDDPALEAIAAPNRARKEWLVSTVELEAAEERTTKKRDPRIRSLRKRVASANKAEKQAESRLAKTKPRTSSGAAAMLAYVNHERFDGEYWCRTAIETVSDALAGSRIPLMDGAIRSSAGA